MIEKGIILSIHALLMALGWLVLVPAGVWDKVYRG